MRFLRVAAVALPLLLVPRPVGRGPFPPPSAPAPGAHAVDVWLGHADAVVNHARVERESEAAVIASALRGAARPGPDPTLASGSTVPLGAGFSIIGDVAVIEANPDGMEIDPTPDGRLFGMKFENLGAVSRRFLAAFGDHFDQIAMYLTFVDRYAANALAYSMPIKNDVKGLGMTFYDNTPLFGSPAGRLKVFLNMKRITVYGRDPANQPQNALYPVWSQEAAHRWLVYFRVQKEGEDAPSDKLLGRGAAHWAPFVQTDASTMDGYRWQENEDGTFTALERFKRYGAVDQYAMGIRTPDEVPPFYILEDVTDSMGRPIAKTGPVNLFARYNATKVDLTVGDIIRGSGPREPAFDPSAEDLRMGVVLVTHPGYSTATAVGEAYRIDRTRALWDDFYNAAVGGRGRVCTTLLHPCRGDVLTFGDPQFLERVADPASRDGVLAPGESFVVSIPVIAAGTEASASSVTLTAPDGITLSRASASPGRLAPGESGVATFEGRVGDGVPCGQPLRFELSAPGRLGPSRDAAEVVLGLRPGPVDDLEGEVGGWRVNPDGKDTADQGAWERATPQRTVAFDFVLQAAGAWSGSQAFVTGAAPGADPSDNDVDHGRTTLESPPFSLAGLREPRLHYRAYFVTADFYKEMLVPGTEDGLRVFAATDGVEWVEVDRLAGMDLGWRERRIKLGDHFTPEALARGTVRVRFVAEDAGVVDNVVEAAIDDIGLYGEAPSCAGPLPEPPAEPARDAAAELPQALGGGGCACRLSVASTARGVAAPWLALAWLGLLGRGRVRGWRAPERNGVRT